MFWLDGEERRTFRFAELLPCPAVIHRLSVKEGEACVLYDRHPGPHSWDVVDPLADLMAERVRDEVRREREGGGGEKGDGGGGGGRPGAGRRCLGTGPAWSPCRAANSHLSYASCMCVSRTDPPGPG